MIRIKIKLKEENDKQASKYFEPLSVSQVFQYFLKISRNKKFLKRTKLKDDFKSGQN